MNWWHYLLLSNLYLILFYGFYVLLLQRETFFQLNRIYLVGSAVMSFLIPVIQLDWVKQWFITQKVQQTIYSASPAIIYRIKVVQPEHITLGQVIGSIYIAGILLLSVKLIWQLFILSRVMQNKQVAAAWSFFKKIKVDKELAKHDVITAHEEVHARQWHSADVLLIEVIMIMNWFNPVVYLYRRAIKHTHEFIADRDALKAGASKSEYAMLLLSQTFNAPVHHLLNPFFNHSVLKQRIKMLQKNKSHYSALIKYGFSAPLFALMLALSSATINNSDVVKTIHKQAVKLFLAPATVVSTGGIEELTTKRTSIEKDDNIKQAEPAQAMPDTETAITPNVLMNTDSNTVNTGNEVLTHVEKLPEFVGGVSGFYQYLGKNLHYPGNASESKTGGRAVVTFVVEPDGSLTDVKALRSPGSSIAEEAVRVVAASPKWIPGEQNGKKVRVQFTVPVVFSAGEDREPADSSKATGIRNVHYFRREFHTADKLIGDSSRSGPVKIMVFKTRIGDANAKKPLLIIDGEEAPAELSLASVDPQKIQSVSVLKNENATRLYGERSKDGVIIISTKKQ